MTAVTTIGAELSLRPIRMAVTGASVLAVQFILCWLVIFVTGAGPTHMFLQIFTAQPPASVGALVEGLGWSVVFGALTGLLVAILYNAFRRIRV
jgi:hypothetical protein